MRSVALNRKYLPYAVALTLAASAALVTTSTHGVTLNACLLHAANEMGSFAGDFVALAQPGRRP